MRRAWVAAALLIGANGPYDIILFATSTAPSAAGAARLVFAPSPFGIAVTPEGVASYDVQLDLSGLPAPAALGASFTSYIVWETPPDLSTWNRLGTVRNGRTTVGRIERNKFLLVITAEADSLAPTRRGPTVLHGTSPSSWLQSFVTHPLFRGLPPG